MKIIELFEEEDQSEKILEAVELIKRDCKPFLEQAEGRLMFRGSRNKSGPIEMFSKRSVRLDRRPTNTAKHVHDQMDDWFEKKFGVRARSQTAFATGNFREAKGYGVVYCMFPIGDFKFIWSPRIEDLFIGLKEKDEEDVPGFLETAWYQDTDLPEALRSNNEIMIACKEYYLLLANGPEDREKLIGLLE